VVVVSDDDDWFERALREDGEEVDNADGSSEADGADGSSEADGADGSSEADGADGSSEADGVDGSSEVDSPTETPDWLPDGDDDDGPDADVGGSDAGDGDATAPAEDNAARTEPDNDGGETPFDQDFASALQNAPDPDVGGPSRPGGQGGEPNPFGGGEDGGGSPFGDQDAGGSPFGPDDGTDGFGFGDAGADGPESFDEVEFESDLNRLDVGIDGLDQMILGGVPRRSLMVAIGSAGTGKTTFGLQFLNHGLEQGENAVYITLEESYDRIISTADEKGWGFGEYAADDRLAIVDIDPIEMSNSLDSIQNDLPNLIEEFGADRLVLDSVSLLEMMYESPPQRRSQVFGFARALKDAGVTTLLTSEADRDHAYASRFGIVEYLADAVFVLQYVRPSDFRETRLAVEIQKIRDANHSRETKPYDLTDQGISVYRQANIF